MVNFNCKKILNFKILHKHVCFYVYFFCSVQLTNKTFDAFQHLQTQNEIRLVVEVGQCVTWRFCRVKHNHTVNTYRGWIARFAKSRFWMQNQRRAKIAALPSPKQISREVSKADFVVVSNHRLIDPGNSVKIKADFIGYISLTVSVYAHSVVILTPTSNALRELLDVCAEFCIVWYQVNLICRFALTEWLTHARAMPEAMGSRLTKSSGYFEETYFSNWYTVSGTERLQMVCVVL